MVIANMCLLEILFRGFWFVYYPAIAMMFRRDLAGWSAATAILFPKQTICEHFVYGPSGSIQNKDFACLLALNILNDKIFAFIWLWLLLMLIVSLLNVCYSTVCFASKTFRMKVLRAQVPSMRAEQVLMVTNRADFGDWFMLHQMGRNMHPIVFDDIMKELVYIKTEKYDA